MRIPQHPPDWLATFQEKSKQGSAHTDLQKVFSNDLRDFVRSINDKYLHWDKLRYQQMPGKLDPQLVWLAVQLSRNPQRQEVPITFRGNQKLHYWLPPHHHELVSMIDKKAGGYITTRHSRAIPDDDERYLFNSLMEEAIASSQLEGASTTREKAKEMLRTKRRPRDKAEQMILNNYKAILEIRDLKGEALTPTMLCHLQEVLTEKTLENPDAAGRFRLRDELVSVVDNRTGETVYDPPPADVIEQRIQEVCDFANDRSKPFVHPLIKAIILHFAIGFIHPFVDGNGRTARALFYWYMLKNGYWLFEYLPISRIIMDAPVKYGRAFLYTETDSGDLAYFNHYHLKVVSRAINELHKYLENQQRLLQEANEMLEQFTDLNHRQRELVQNALKHPSHIYSIREHQGKYRITYNTARADLYRLSDLGLLEKSKQGKKKKAWIFRPAPDLMQLLQGKPKKRPTQSGKGTRSVADPGPVQGTLFDPELFQ